MKDLRIVFMGTPEFAKTILQTLVAQKHTVVGVVTAPDKPAGRGQKIRESAVKKYAQSQNIPLLQPTNLKSDEFIKQLHNLNGNLQIVVAFRMLPKVVWQLPALGTFNLHASLLPQYRGAAPIHWAIINGETKTGVTTFFIDDKIDTGNIILQQECSINNDETVGQLHDRLMHLGANLVVKTVALIQTTTIKTVQQSSEETKTAHKLFPENCKINWNESLENIYNKIRGLNPFPAAWTTIDNNGTTTTAKLYHVSKKQAAHSLAIGSIQTSKKTIEVAVQNGFLIIHEIKLAGKKKMDVQSLLNGFDFSNTAKMV